MATFDLFVGGRLEGLTVLSGMAPEQGSGYPYDSDWSDCVIQLQGLASYSFYDQNQNPFVVTAGNYVMAHGWAQLAGGQSGPFMAFLDSTGRPVIAVSGNGNNEALLQQNTGTAAAPNWVQLGTGSVLVNSQFPIDLQVTIDAGGNHTAAFYVNNNLIQQSTFSDAAVASGGLSGVLLSSYNQNNWWSQLYARLNGSTIGAHVKTVRATGPGSYSAWAGAYTDVNEQVTNDTTVNQSTNVGDKQSYPMGNVTVPNGYSISSVWQWLRAKNDGGAPSNIKSLIISGGAEKESADLPGIGLGFATLFQRYDTDPNTSAPWTQAGWNAPVQLGYQSDT